MRCTIFLFFEKPKYIEISILSTTTLLCLGVEECLQMNTKVSLLPENAK